MSIFDDNDTYDKRREEADERERDLANGWRPAGSEKVEHIAETMPHIARFAYEAGMVYFGTNSDGQMEWVGTDKQWRHFRELIYQDEIACQPAF